MEKGYQIETPSISLLPTVHDEIMYEGRTLDVKGKQHIQFHSKRREGVSPPQSWEGKDSRIPEAQQITSLDAQ